MQKRLNIFNKNYKAAAAVNKVFGKSDRPRFALETHERGLTPATISCFAVC